MSTHRIAQNSTIVWLIRHAEVEERYHTIFGGRIDMELSPRGHEQAAALARYLTGHDFAALYASPMRRVSQTLAPVVALRQYDLTVLSELREVDFGDWTGLSWEEVHRKFGISAFEWLTQLECKGIANAECAADLRARLEPCLRTLLKKHEGERIALLCHGGVIRMLLSILLKWPFPLFAPVEIEYASITQVRCSADRVRLELLNFTPWRELSEGGSGGRA
jgi:broad specificity phosphatase PhoE